MNDRCKKIIYVIFVFLIPVIFSIIVSSFPSFRWKYLSWGHDIYYHIQAIKGQSFTLQSGMFPIYINPLANRGAGDCRFVVYPYLFIYIPAFIYGIINDIPTSINIFIIIVNVCTFFVAYKSTMVIYKDKVVAVLASVFYLLCFYRVFNIYDRQAMGEYIALVFTPLVIAGFYDIFFSDKKRWYYLVIGITCIIQSHIITAFYYIVLIILASIICVPIIKKDKSILKYYILAGILSVALNLWYLIPFVQYYIESEIDIVSFGQYVVGFNKFFDNFIIDYRLGERYYNCIGLESLFAMVATPILLVYIKSKIKDKEVKYDKGFITSIVFLIIFYYYFIASIGLFNIGPLTSFYAKQQFLYRELGRGLPFLAMAFSYAIRSIKISKAPILSIVIIYICIVISCYTTVTYISTRITSERADVPCDISLPDYLYYSGSRGDAKREMLSEDDFAILKNNMATVSNAKPIEYGDMHMIEDNGISVAASDVDIKVHDILKGILSYRLYYTYDHDDYKEQYIAVPLVAFTGYRARDEYGHDLSIKRGDSDYITVYLYDKKGKISITFDPPLLWKIADIISLLTFIIIFALRIRYEISMIKKCEMIR